MTRQGVTQSVVAIEMEVVTTDIHNAWAEAHRIPVEVSKKGAEQGHYLHPQLFGKDAKEYGIRGDAALSKATRH